jgi:hypothetical protein
VFLMKRTYIQLFLAIIANYFLQGMLWFFIKYIVHIKLSQSDFNLLFIFHFVIPPKIGFKVMTNLTWPFLY